MSITKKNTKTRRPDQAAAKPSKTKKPAAQVKTAARSRQPKPAMQDLALPGPLNIAMAHFVEWNDAAQVRDNLFKLLHLAMESPTVDYYTPADRSELFFTVRELGLLSDALHVALAK